MMFGLFGNKNKESAAIVKKMYNNMPAENRGKIFYGGYKKACDILLPMSDLLNEGVDHPDKESILRLAQQVYIQVWIRKHGAVSPEFMETDYIKNALKIRFGDMCGNRLPDAIDLAIEYIYGHEPNLRTRDSFMEHSKKMISENARMNKDIELIHINDEDYGLVKDKPIFVNGFGDDKRFLARLLTSDGAKTTYRRLGSLAGVGISGPVDEYEILKEDGTLYGNIYVCNYGNTTPGRAPNGYILAEQSAYTGHFTSGDTENDI